MIAAVSPAKKIVNESFFMNFLGLIEINFMKELAFLNSNYKSLCIFRFTLVRVTLSRVLDSRHRLLFLFYDQVVNQIQSDKNGIKRHHAYYCNYRRCTDR